MLTFPAGPGLRVNLVRDISYDNNKVIKEIIWHPYGRKHLTAVFQFLLTIPAASCHVWMTLLSPPAAQQCEMASGGGHGGDDVYFEQWHLHVRLEPAVFPWRSPSSAPVSVRSPSLWHFFHPVCYSKPAATINVTSPDYCVSISRMYSMIE